MRIYQHLTPAIYHLDFLDRVPAKLVAHGCQQAIGEGRFAARPKPALQGQGDHWRSHFQVDCLENRPATLARIGNPGFDIFQVLILYQGV